jgi:PhnB protein
MNQPARPIPEGFHSLTPHLICEGAMEALSFYQKAFDAVEIDRVVGMGDRIMNATMRIGDSYFMLCDDFPEQGYRGPQALQGTTVTIHLYVPDADAAFMRAVAAGARSIMPPSDMFWGDRYGQVLDPFGHRWSIATHQRDLTPKQIEEAMAAAYPLDCPNG